MVNKQRGQVPYKDPLGKNHTLCLTLGAMAEIETACPEYESFPELIMSLQDKPTIKNLIAILTALIRGGGGADITTEEVGSWPIDMPPLMTSIGLAFQAADFSNGEAVEEVEKT